VDQGSATRPACAYVSTPTSAEQGVSVRKGGCGCWEGTVGYQGAPASG